MSVFSRQPLVPPAATAPDESDAPSDVADLFTGHDHLGEYLLTVYADGSREIAWRARSWETWSPPIKLTAVAL